VVLHLLAAGDMLTILMLAAALAQSPKVDIFSTQADIQGLYEDIRQMAAQSTTATDVDTLHDVLYTDDWTFVDKSGQSHSWTEIRQKQVDALTHKSDDAYYQPIRKISVSADGQTATVTIVENKTTYKDTWVRSGESWKMKTRQQLD
jgi:ketosteroid isomerase-like protein